MNFFLNRLREPSTWRGFIMLATGLGVAMSPETIEQVVVAGTAMTGLIGMFTTDGGQK